MSKEKILGKSSFFLFSLSASLLVIPRYEQILWFVYLFIFLALVYQMGVVVGRFQMIRPRLTTLLALLSMLLVGVMAQVTGGLVAMINLFFVAYGLKFIEQKSARDVGILVLLGFFGCGINFVFDQSIPFTLYLFVALILTCGAAIAFETGSYQVSQPLQRAAFLVLCSVPLAVLLFVVVPRIGPLWALPDTKRATSGLSDHLTPGGIAQLSLNSDLAFRAVFKGDAPLPKDMYWRAMTQEVFDGESWRIHPRMGAVGSRKSISLPPLVEKNGNPLSYEILIEPHGQNWLFTLDVSEVLGNDVLSYSDASWRSKMPIVRKKQLDAVVWSQSILDSHLSAEVREINLMIPLLGNPKSRAFGEQLRHDYQEPEKRVQAVLGFLQKAAFVYTLEPPILYGDQIDMFLFETRAGFCEHYASSFTYLMRAANIPARVVSGYLGGELHPTGSHYSIYQFDAHAWTEIWLQGRGWVRVDPTIVVAPERSVNLENALPDQFRSLTALSLVRYRGVSWLNEIRNGWLLLDYNWTRWVIGFDDNSQTNILKHLLGAITFLRVASFLLGIMTLIVLVIIGSLQWTRVRNLAFERRLFARACRKMGRAGWSRAETETVLSYQQRLEFEQVSKAGSMKTICGLYQRLRYDQMSDSERKSMMKQLAQAVRKL